MQATFEAKPWLEDDQVVGIQLNMKDPIDIAEKLPAMKSGQVKVSNLRKSFYLYIPKKECSHFRHKKNEDAKIECVFEKGWLKLRWLPKWRFGTAESFFGSKCEKGS